MRYSSNSQSGMFSHLQKQEHKTNTSVTKTLLSKGRRTHLKREWNKKLFTFDNMSKMNSKMQRFYKEYTNHYLKLKQDKTTNQGKLYNIIDDMNMQNANIEEEDKYELTSFVKKFHETQKKYNYCEKTDDSDKYLTKRTLNFLDWKKSRQYRHIMKLWKKCFIKANAASTIINQLSSLDLKVAYFGRHQLASKQREENYE